MKIYTYIGERPLVVKQDETVLIQEGCRIRLRHQEERTEPIKISLADDAHIITARQFWEACEAVTVTFRKMEGGYEDVPLTKAFALSACSEDGPKHPLNPMMQLAIQLGLEKKP